MLERRAEVKQIYRLERTEEPVYEIEYDFVVQVGSKFNCCPMIMRFYVVDELGAYNEFKKYCDEENINVIWL